MLTLLCVVWFGCLRSDINGDGRVDLGDLAIMASEWMQESCMALGPELVTNGGFDSDLSSWVSDPLGAFAQSDGKAVWDSDLSSEASLTQTVAGESGKKYKLSFTISSVSGFSFLQSSASVQWGGGSVSFLTSMASGTYNAFITHNGVANSLIISGGNFNENGGFAVDNVSVKEVLSGVPSIDTLDQVWEW
jgi:hypothetical protein